MRGETVLYSPDKGRSVINRKSGQSAMLQMKERMAKTLESEDSLELEEQKELEARAQSATGKRLRGRKPWDMGGRPSTAPNQLDLSSSRERKKEEVQIIDLSTLRKGAFGPHYSLAEVLKFRQNFNSVDIDMSGNMDMTEWQSFLQRMNQAMSPTEAQLLFMHIDKDRSGIKKMHAILSILSYMWSNY